VAAEEISGESCLGVEVFSDSVPQSMVGRGISKGEAEEEMETIKASSSSLGRGNPNNSISNHICRWIMASQVLLVFFSNNLVLFLVLCLLPGPSMAFSHNFLQTLLLACNQTNGQLLCSLVIHNNPSKRKCRTIINNKVWEGVTWLVSLRI
jgi:hypothetical protein